MSHEKSLGLPTAAIGDNIADLEGGRIVNALSENNIADHKLGLHTAR